MPETIEIPLRDSLDEVVELDFSSLPEADEMVSILRQECTTLDCWLTLALQYYRQGNVDAFLKVLETSRTAVSRTDYKDFQRDQVCVLGALAAYYAQEGSREKCKDKREELFGKASLLYSSADTLALYDQNHLLGKAFFCLWQGGKMEQADTQFNFLLSQSPNNPLALLGKACIAFNRKDYRGALTFYRKVLRTNPNSPASIRVGLGHCFYKLGNPERAKMAFERALQLDPKCVGALIGLGVMEINKKTPKGIQMGIKLFSQAYAFNSSNPMALNHLANYFLCKNKFDEAKHLAFRAFHIADHESIKAESCYHIARAYHAQDDYDQAFNFYFQATVFAPTNFILPHFGLGQMYIHRADTERAIECFEKVLKVVPDSYEVMKILGSLYSSSKDQEVLSKGKNLLQKVTEKFPQDVEAWINFGQILQNSDLQGALIVYVKAMKTIREELKLSVPPELLNNAGVIDLRLQNTKEAEKYLEKALNHCNKRAKHDSTYFTCISVIINYNLARLDEALCKFDKAENRYKDIIKQHPHYIDCYLRLGCIASATGQTYEASDWIKEAMRYDQEHPDAWALLGNLHLSKMEWGPGQKKFERILNNPNTAHDNYSLIALGNVWLQSLTQPTRDKEKLKRHEERALSIFKTALKNDPQNIWAANGIGAVLATKGFINEARDIFAQVREATADFQDVWLNIAHIYVEQKQYISAIQMYENCIRKFYNHHSIKILQYLARAYVKAGKLREAKIVLLKARRVAPHDTVVLYNIAYVLQRLAASILKDPKSTLKTVTKAVHELGTAQKLFTYLSVHGDKMRYDIKQAAGQAHCCQDLLSQAQYHVTRAQKVDEEELKLRRKQEEERKAFQIKQQEELKKEEEKKRIELQEMLRRRQEFRERTKKAIVFDEASDKVKSRGRKRKDTEFQTELEEETVPEKKARLKKRTTKQKRTSGITKPKKGIVKKATGKPRQQRKLKAGRGKRKQPQDEEEEEEPLHKKFKSKAYVSTTESDSDRSIRDWDKGSKKENEETGCLKSPPRKQSPSAVGSTSPEKSPQPSIIPCQDTLLPSKSRSASRSPSRPSCRSQSTSSNESCSRSVSKSRSRSASKSRSRSASKTRSRSASKSLSRSASRSRSRSANKSRSRSPSKSRSRSSGKSPSRSAGKSPSRSASKSSSRSASKSPSRSASKSSSRSASKSSSRSASRSSSRSASRSSSRSASKSSSSSTSRSCSRSSSKSPSRSASRSQSRSTNKSHSRSASKSRSRSTSKSRSRSASKSRSRSASETRSRSASKSCSRSASRSHSRSSNSSHSSSGSSQSKSDNSPSRSASKCESKSKSHSNESSDHLETPELKSESDFSQAEKRTGSQVQENANFQEEENAHFKAEENVDAHPKEKTNSKGAENADSHAKDNNGKSEENSSDSSDEENSSDPSEEENSQKSSDNNQKTSSSADETSDSSNEESSGSSTGDDS